MDLRNCAVTTVYLYIITTVFKMTQNTLEITTVLKAKWFANPGISRQTNRQNISLGNPPCVWGLHTHVHTLCVEFILCFPQPKKTLDTYMYAYTIQTTHTYTHDLHASSHGHIHNGFGIAMTGFPVIQHAHQPRVGIFCFNYSSDVLEGYWTLQFQLGQGPVCPIITINHFD
jgi:hypothetical protein